MVRTMSKIFSVMIMMVVSTTTSVLRIIGMVTRKSSLLPRAPSTRAASTMSAGIPLIAAASTTMAKPVCVHTMITMSRKVFSGMLSSQFGGCDQPNAIATWLSRPICGCDGSRAS